MTGGELLALATANFLGVLLAVWLINLKGRLRNRAVAMSVLEKMGERARLEETFAKIIDQNFRGGDADDDGEDRK